MRRLAPLALVVLLAACGKGEARRLAAADYRAKADAACARFDRELTASVREGVRRRVTPVQGTRLTEPVRRRFVDAMAGLRALGLKRCSATVSR